MFDSNTAPIDSALFIVADVSKPCKEGFVRVWFRDNIGTTSGWRDIPASRVDEAEAFVYECEDDPLETQEFDFDLQP